jgi:hypothetical protein
MINGTMCFGAGFLAGQAVAIFAFRHAIDSSGVVDTDPVFAQRFLIVLGIETAVAAISFHFGARIGRASASAIACAFAFLAGVITNAVTVGAYALVPPIINSDAQLGLYFLAVALLSAAAGWLFAKLFNVKVRHAA